MVLLRETAAVLAVGLLLGVAVGLVRGFPAPPPPPPGATSCQSPIPDRPAIQWITQVDALPLASDGQVAFVDARDTTAFVEGHVAGALSVPLDTGTITREVVALLRGYHTIV